MRSHLSRTTLAASLLLAISACSDATNGISSITSPNTLGAPVPATAGVGTPPTGTVSPRLIDDGTVSKGRYTGFNVSATDTQSATQSSQDLSTSPNPPNPPSPASATDAGSHMIAFSGSGSTQVILTYGGTVPSLVYTFANNGNSANYDLSTIVLHASYVAGTTSPGTLSGIAVELVGGSSTSAYDVRIPCTLPSGGLTASFQAVTCATLPSYPTSGFTTTNPNTQGPNAVTPGVTGQFTPFSPKLYVVLTYSAASATGGTATLGLDDIYGKQ